jgi:hypothetical protein
MVNIQVFDKCLYKSGDKHAEAGNKLLVAEYESSFLYYIPPPAARVSATGEE